MKTLLSNISIALFAAGFLYWMGCADRPAEQPEDAAGAETAEAPPVLKAVAMLAPTQGNQASGTVTFTETMDGVRVEADVSGLSQGMHGFHIHEFGDCSAPDGTSAGGHFNPVGSPHGAPAASAPERHVGDLGNLEAGADGTATYDRVDTVISLEGSDAVVGKAVIVHAGEDDLTTQPTGNAGDRLACGVIELQGGM